MGTENDFMIYEEVEIRLDLKFINELFDAIENFDVNNFQDIFSNVLREIATFLNVENILVYYFNKYNQTRYIFSGKQNSDGCIPSDKTGIFTDFEKVSKMFPYLRKSLSINTEVKISSLEEIPEEAVYERKYLENANIASLFMTKLQSQNTNYAVLCYTSTPRFWDEKSVELISFYGKILTIKLDKFFRLIELEKANTKLRTISDFTYHLEKWISPEGKLEYISPSCFRITGYTQEEFYYHLNLMEEIIYPDDYEKWKGNRIKLLESKFIEEFEYRIVKKDKQIRWIHQSGQKVITERGDFLGWRTSCNDITEHKQAEFKLEIANKKIIEFNKVLEQENLVLKQNSKTFSIPGIISSDPEMQKILEKVKQVAPADSPVLIIGETGTGKELIARAIHDLSARKSKPMVTVNCAAIPAALIESELFGREKGAYTGAMSRQIGRFEAANKSSIFLDEIGELPIETQSKLLRVLQFGEFQMLGSNTTQYINTRIIAATNKNLAEGIKNGNFREDLFYRINVFPIFLPPLRERKADIPLLVWEFVEEFSNKMGKRISEISKANMDKLVKYNWPGNLRELRNVIEYSMIMSKSRSLQVEFHNIHNDSEIIGSTLEEVERNHILRTLEKVNWRIRGKNGAAEILGLNESTLRFRMKKLGLIKETY